MPEEEPQNIVDQFWALVEQLLLPNWSDLILLLPWVLIALVLVWLTFTALQWRRAAAPNRCETRDRSAADGRRGRRRA